MYGALSPKRHRGYTNNPHCAKLDLGIYKRSIAAKRTKIKTVKKYQSKDGKAAYVGTKQLKPTQSVPQLSFDEDYLKIMYW